MTIANAVFTLNAIDFFLLLFKAELRYAIRMQQKVTVVRNIFKNIQSVKINYLFLYKKIQKSELD